MVKKIIGNSFLYVAFIFAMACNGTSDKKMAESKVDSNLPSVDKYEQKKKDGVDFIAVGDQPTWEVDIDLQKAIWFTTLEENVTALTTPVPQAVKSSDGNTVTYEATVDAGSIKVIITNQPCINSSTGEVFDHSVEVQTSGKVFKGCGKYLN